MSETKTIKIFNKFVDFVCDLNEVFGTQMKSLKMYHILVTSLKEKYAENNDKYQDQITKHVDILTNFLITNKDAIYEQKSNSIVMKNLQFSDHIYIDFELVLRHSEEKSAIWKHLLFLSSLCNPDGKAKDALMTFLEDDTPENNIIKNIASKLEESKFTEKMASANTSNPMDMMAMLGSSGLLSSIMSSVNQNNLNQVDPKKLIKTMKNMLDNISQQIDADESLRGPN
jgi:hypothetical protein